MSITAAGESTKKNPILDAVASGAPPGEKNKPKLTLEPPANAPAGDAAKFAALNSPGVSASVFGPMSPNVKIWSDEQLCKNLIALRAAMKANPGKVNAYDFKLYAELQTVAALRWDAKLTPKVAPEKMGTKDLVDVVLGLEVKRASGQSLSKEQTDFLAKADKVLAERAKHEPELKNLQELRAKLQLEVKVKCGAVLTGAAGLVGAEFVGALGSGMLIAHALKEGDYQGALKETVSLGVLFVSNAGYKKALEALILLDNVRECRNAVKELSDVEKALLYEKTAKDTLGAK